MPAKAQTGVFNMKRDSENAHIRQLKADMDHGRMHRREFLRLALLLGIAAPAAYAMAGESLEELLIPSAEAATTVPGSVLRFGGRVKDVKTPHTYSWGAYDSNMSRQVVEYLTYTDETGLTRPYLCTKWEVSDDLRTWTFHIRQGVKWRKGGKPLTADDVIWNLKRVLDPAVGSSMIGLMKGYMLDDVDTGTKDSSGKPVLTTKLWSDKAIEKIDDYTFRFNCKTAQVAIPEHLFSYPMAIMDPAEGGVFGIGANGTGAYEMTEYELGKRAVFKASKACWRGAPTVETIEFVDLGDDATAAIAALASKQIDGLIVADPIQYTPLKAIPHLQLYQVATAETAVMRMKVTEKPFTDKRVRQAFRLAIDPKPIVEVAVAGLGITGEHTHVSPANPEYAKITPFKRDVAKAKSLLAEAGYPNGIEVELVVPTDIPWEQVQAEAALQQWAEAGIKVKLNVMPGAQYWDIWTKVPFGTTIWYHRPLAIMTLALGYRTGVPWNESSYSNPEFDQLLSQAEATLDVEQRKVIMAKLEAIMQDDGPLVQPLFRNVFTFIDKKVKGFRMHPSTYVFCWRMSV